MTKGRQVYLFVLWAKARPFEDEIREILARDFKILLETEMSWSRWNFTRKLREFYGFGSRFTWWNKARKCGRGSFMVFLVEDLHPEFKTATDTRGQCLLVNEHVYRDKQAFRQLTRHSNIVHSSVTEEETDAQMKVLFGCGTEDFLSLLTCDLKSLGAGSRRVCHEIIGTNQCLKGYRDELEAMLKRGDIKRVGDGSRRICYAIGETGYCLKGYRREEDLNSRMRPDGTFETHLLKPSTVREIRTARFDEQRNTSCQEWHYYRELKAKLPQELFAVFPETLERVLVPSLGWCLVENLIVNADGSPVRKFAPVYRDADELLQKQLLAKLLALRNGLMQHAVRFYDPQNVMVQFSADGSFRLRIIDFEPSTRTWISIDGAHPFLVRQKCARRFRRFIKASLHVKGAIE